MLSDMYGKLDALAESNRLKILDLFEDVNELTPSMISQLTGIKPNLLTHHMQALKRAGFITIRKSGRMKIVTRDNEQFRDLKNAFENIYLRQAKKEHEDAQVK